jgi:hypothetical protein
MTETKITEQVRVRLDEVAFVYKQLPLTLERARRTTLLERWNAFFHDQARAVRRQQAALRQTTASWGVRTRPCFCPWVEDQLNEARHALSSKRGPEKMEDNIGRILSALRKRVLVLLEEAVDLAVKIREPDLAQQLRSMLQVERVQQEVAQQLVVPS